MRILLLTAFASLVFSSCSVTRQLEKSARTTVLQANELKTAHVGISIFDPATGKYWFNHQGDKYFVPASNTKIPTCYAAMKYLGDSLVGFRYSVDNGNIMLTASGDPTFLHPDFNSKRAIDLLSGSNGVSIRLIDYDFGYFGSGWTANDFLASYMTERSPLPLYGNMSKFFIENGAVQSFPRYFKKELINNDKPDIKGFEIERQREANNFHVKEGKEKQLIVPFHTRDFLDKNIGYTIQRELLSDTLKREVTTGNYITTPELLVFHSQPTDTLLKPMMHRSDNFFAEQSLLMVSNEKLGFMSDAKIIDTLLKTDLKDLPQKPRWVDGSGLSRYNLFTPQDFVFILNKMKNEFGMSRIKEIFPTGGEGTFSSYYKKDSTFLYAKTGTLSGVVAISGFLTTKKGQELIFSVLVNNHNGSATNVRRAVEKFIQGIREKY
jgi:serine-type D-Ala-D-Ala carboxypeptidase/endopeptidase (penicillin-binding protein 4)